MKKALSILALAALAASASTAAMACSYHTVAQSGSAPITTAQDTHPSTPAPKPGG